MKKLLLFILVVNSLFSQTLKQKIGQMIIVGFNGKFIPQLLKDDLEKRNLGGVVLFAGNIANPTQIKKLNDSINLFSSIKSFIAIDQEGGKVARLSYSNGYESTPTAYRLGTIINLEDSTRFYSKKMAQWLTDAGINLNFAPVVDINVNPNSPAIGKSERSFSKNSKDVINNASWFIDEFKKKNIFTCLKHFPGHGSALQDSHLGFTDVTNTWADSELVPYKNLVGSGYNDFVMIGHLYNKNLDSIYPASLSKKTIDILRKQFNFSGIILTDELFMQAITQNYTFENSIELALNAGNDILLFNTNYKNNFTVVDSVVKIVETKVNEGKISLDRINESYNRIMEMKGRKNLNRIVINNSPTEMYLMNFPNPFNPETKIIYRVPNDLGYALVQLKIYDILGREVSTLVNENQLSGEYGVTFRPNNISSGIYYYALRISDKIYKNKMVFLK